VLAHEGDGAIERVAGGPVVVEEVAGKEDEIDVVLHGLQEDFFGRV
jgi:hypothetical protein